MLRGGSLSRLYLCLGFRFLGVACREASLPLGIAHSPSMKHLKLRVKGLVSARAPRRCLVPIRMGLDTKPLPLTNRWFSPGQLALAACRFSAPVWQEHHDVDKSKLVASSSIQH